MDAGVKVSVWAWVFGVHGGVGAGAGRPARAQRRLVTLRFAGRDRMTVSGRELPRTRDASSGVPDRIDNVEVPHRVGAGRRAPACELFGWFLLARIHRFGLVGLRVRSGEGRGGGGRGWSAVVVRRGGLVEPRWGASGGVRRRRGSRLGGRGSARGRVRRGWVRRGRGACGCVRGRGCSRCARASGLGGGVSSRGRVG